MRHSVSAHAGVCLHGAIRACGLLLLTLALWAGEASVGWKDASLTIGEAAGQAQAQLKVTGRVTGPITVTWQTVDGTAIAGTHYVAASGTVVIPTSAKSADVAVAVIDNAVYTGDTTVLLRITAVTGGELNAPADAVVTIADNDPVVAPVEAPTISPAAGTYQQDVLATATTATAGAELRYRLDGQDPAVSDPLLPADGLAITQPATLVVRAFRAGAAPSPVATAAYAFAVAPVSASLAAGTYVGTRDVVLASATAGAAIHYTLDGSRPSAASPVASGAITLPGSCTLRALATRDGWASSALFSARYTLRVPTPTVSPAAGRYTAALTATATDADPDAVIRYAIGSNPVATSPEFPLAGLPITQTTDLRLRAYRSGWSSSRVLRAVYTLRVAPVVASLPAGTYVGEQQVTLATATTGAIVRYTLDGLAPTVDSPVADGPVTISGNRTLRAVAMLDGWSNSTGFRAAYRLRVPAPLLTPAAGTYPAWPLVTAASTDAAATIRYTLGATLPGSTSPIFPAGGLQLTQAGTVNVIATRTGWTNSLATSAAYERNLPPVVSALGLSGDEDAVISGLPVASDPEGQALIWSLGVPPGHGEAVVEAATGAVIYTPAADWSGSDAFTLAVSDGFSATELPVTVTVAPIDDPAVIVAAANGSTTIGSDLVLSGFLVTDGDSSAVSIAVSVDAGTISLTALGGSGATLASGSGMGDAQIVLEGAPAAVSAALAQVVWRAPDVPATATLVLAGNGGQAAVELAATSVAPVTVQPAAVTAWSGVPHATQILPTAASLWRVDVRASGRYHLWLRGAGAVVGVDLDGTAVGSLALPEAEGWSCRAGTTVLTLDLATGEHVLRCAAPAGAIVAGMLVAQTADSIGHAEPVVVGPGSVAVVEAEDYDEALGNDGTAWLPVVYGAANARRALPDIAQVQEAVGHALAYDVWVTAPGTYRMWIRASGAGDSDSVNVAVDGVPVFNGINPESWPWSAQNLAWGAMSVTQTRSDIVIPSAGLHRITVSFREDGVALDQIALSGIPAWRPREVAHPACRRDGIQVQGADQVLSLDAAVSQAVPAREQHEWVRQVAPFAGEADVLRAMPDVAKQVARTDVATTAAAFWQVRFTTAGTYALWLRGTGPNFSSDSWHVGLAGDLSGAGDLSLNQNLPAAALAWSNTRQDGTKATITVPAPGDYAIGVWMREDGAAMQRLVIQPTTEPAPAGAGPATSPWISVAPTGDG